MQHYFDPVHAFKADGKCKNINCNNNSLDTDDKVLGISIMVFLKLICLVAKLFLVIIVIMMISRYVCHLSVVQIFPLFFKSTTPFFFYFLLDYHG